MTTSFLSPTDLGLFPHQHSSLIETLQMLEAGLLRHIVPERFGRSYEALAPETDDIPNTHVFNMNCWLSEREEDCGSIGCIGGTACLIAGDLKLFHRFPAALDNNYTEEMPTALYNLFYPTNDGISYDNITPEEAAKQLRLYLTTGTHDWNTPPDAEPADPVEGDYNEQ